MATGKKSALTGKEWRKGIHKGDYCVIPQQKWLDGYVIEKGVVAQFVAVPLGQELTVEEQLGGDGIGGIQIEVYPMKADCFERRWPKQPPPKLCERGADARGILRSRKKGLTKSAEPIACAASTMDFGLESLCEMGIGAGGRMKQQVFEDPYGKDEWCKGSIKSTRKCFAHLANSMAWENITGEAPPETPVTAAVYERYGMPWFDFYSDDFQAMKGAKKFKGVKTVKDQAKEKGLKGVLPENESVTPKHVVKIKEVQDGNW